ncbi:hypothetical protein K6U06_20940 [Acidiferrimicrobium sp. IK]|uniref:glutaredoxin family protein n=1 Tax=Acidiferrimicrobium sp. IK TaxID=2871700 RepID=UPI0021CAFDB4|nr:glutaredoxin domain-containing protein [Acidiferrimicrobium sp. IK]MCU4186845.1 hypothetical protein [Acidiferrimicrobium sp. IK]
MTETPLPYGTDRPDPAGSPSPAERPGPAGGTGPAERRGPTGDARRAEDGSGDGETPAVDVYWRPGCGYCGRLFRALERAGVPARRINIWEDDDARRFVRDHNRGNETVPTVDFGGRVRTNPHPDDLIEEIRAAHPAMPAAPARSGWWNRRH